MTRTVGVRSGPTFACGLSVGTVRSEVVTRAGNRMVNVEPTPGVLSTAMSPPMASQKWRVIASPRPVPPTRRVGDGSIWEKGRKSFVRCSGSMPMPVSVTRKVNQPLVLLLAGIPPGGWSRPP